MDRKFKIGFRARAYRGGIAFLTVALLINLACEYAALVGASFAGDTRLTSLTYWTWIVAVCFPIVPYLLMVLSTARGRAGVAAFGVAMFVVAIAWQAWTILWQVLTLADCEGDIHCAGNLSYIGAITGSYRGPSVRFVFLFVASLVMLIMEIVAAGLLFGVRRELATFRMATAARLAADPSLDIDSEFVAGDFGAVDNLHGHWKTTRRT